MKFIKTIENFTKYLLILMICLFSFLCIYIVTMKDILKHEYINILGYSYFVVVTGSMEDTIHVNDIVFINFSGARCTTLFDCFISSDTYNSIPFSHKNFLFFSWKTDNCSIDSVLLSF